MTRPHTAKLARRLTEEGGRRRKGEGGESRPLHERERRGKASALAQTEEERPITKREEENHEESSSSSMAKRSRPGVPNLFSLRTTLEHLAYHFSA